MRVFGKALPPSAATLLGTNIVLLGLCVPIFLTHHGWSTASDSAGLAAALKVLIRLIAVGLFCQTVFYYHELYNLQVARNVAEQLSRLLSAIGIAMLILAGVYAVAPALSPGRDALLGLAPALIVVIVITRLVIVQRRPTRVAIIGPELSRKAVQETIETCSEWNMELVEAYDIHDGPSPAAASHLDRVIVCAEARQTPQLIERLTHLKMRGIRVETAARFYEEATGRVQVDEIRPEWFVFSSGFENGNYKRLAKRCFDLLAASLMLILASPWMLLAIAAIVFERKGPIIFWQDRVGLYGKTFRILKFRTMIPAPPGATPQWAANNDKRITALGRLMRTFRIDELPQLLNVLRGDMSLVGPRPEQPYFCQLLADNIPFYHQRHTVPPGLTGWAQVRYRYGATIAESKRKLEFDLFYVKHLSIWFDLAILFETVKVVLVGRGAK
jgi:exopolysaccharide biosynthesis polyprenyl glycosylphosphotransferase